MPLVFLIAFNEFSTKKAGWGGGQDQVILMVRIKGFGGANEPSEINILVRKT